MIDRENPKGTRTTVHHLQSNNRFLNASEARSRRFLNATRSQLQGRRPSRRQHRSASNDGNRRLLGRAGAACSGCGSDRNDWNMDSETKWKCSVGRGRSITLPRQSKDTSTFCFHETQRDEQQDYCLQVILLQATAQHVAWCSDTIFPVQLWDKIILMPCQILVSRVWCLCHRNETTGIVREDLKQMNLHKMQLWGWKWSAYCVFLLKFESARKERRRCTELLYKRCMASSMLEIVLIIKISHMEQNRAFISSMVCSGLRCPRPSPDPYLIDFLHLFVENRIILQQAQGYPRPSFLD